MNKNSSISVDSRSLPVLLALACCAPAALTMHTARAQQTNASDGPIAPAVEVTAFRVPTLLSETSQGVSVISGEEISARNPSSVIEMLQEVPGLYVDQVGSPGGVSNIHVRGSDPEHVLVLIDGVRVNDSMLSRGGSYDLSSLDTTDIERIEIIRGAGSALYGADAMGAVINIVTRQGKPGEMKATVAGGIGGQGYGRAQASASGGSDRMQVSLNASKLQDGRDEDGGELDLATFSGSLALRPSDVVGVKIYARHNDRESTSFPDFSGGIERSVVRTLERRDAKETTIGADVSLEPLEKIGFKLQVARYDREEDIDSPGVSPFTVVFPTVSHTDFTRDSALVSTLLKLPLDSDLTVGYEHLSEEGHTRSLSDLTAISFGLFQGDFDLERDTDSTFAELKSKPAPNLIATLGVRHDSVENFNSETSPSAGIRYTVQSTQTTLKAHYSEGFRPPSFFALGNPLFGNPDLEVETSKSGEIGVEQALGNSAQFGVSVFRTRYKNLIDFDTGSNMLVNRDKVKAEGVELEFAVRPIDKLSIGGNYTYVSTEFEGSSEKLRNRPKHRAALLLRYAFSEAWRFSWNTIYVGEFFDSSIPTGDVKLDSYTRTDVSASYKWNRFTATFAIDNLFDEDYQQFVGFVDPGIRARVGLSASF